LLLEPRRGRFVREDFTTKPLKLSIDLLELFVDVVTPSTEAFRGFLEARRRGRWFFRASKESPHLE
jgi:hypothetical protein